MVQAKQPRTRRSSNDQSSLGAFQTVVWKPPVHGVSWTKHQSGCRDFQAGRFDVRVLASSDVRKIKLMKKILVSDEFEPIPEKKLFYLPSYLVGAIFGVLIFLILLFLIEIIPIPGESFLLSAVLWPGLLLTDRLGTSLISYSLFFLISSFPFALIGSLIFTNNERRKSLGLVFLLIYIAISVCIGGSLFFVGSLMD